MCIYKCEGIAHVCTHIHTLTKYTGQAWGANLPLAPHSLRTQPRVLLPACTLMCTHVWLVGAGEWGCERVPPVPPQSQPKAAIQEAIFSLQNLNLILHLKARGD